MKVKLRKNVRSFEFEDTTFNLYNKDVKELAEKDIKAYSIKHALFTGKLVPAEGFTVMNVKHAKVLFDAELYPLAYGIEFGKYFEKDLEMDTIVWKARDTIPASALAKLEGQVVQKEMKVEEEEKEEEVEVQGEQTKTDLFGLNRMQQIEKLKDLGLSKKEIKELNNEQKRVDKILELQS